MPGLSRSAGRRVMERDGTPCLDHDGTSIDDWRMVKPTSRYPAKTLVGVWLTALLGSVLTVTSFGVGVAAAAPAGCAGTVPSDFNGDGVSDVAVGEPGSSLAAPGSGAVHVLYGSKSGLLVNATSSTPDDQIITGTNVPDAEFGESVVALDFNGDGCTDLAVGAPQDAPLGVPGAGRVWLYLGSPGGLVLTSQTPIDSASAANVVPQPDAHFGWSLAGGDTIADGLDDLVIGAPNEVVDGMAHGAVYVLPGRPTDPGLVPGVRLDQGEGAVPASDGQSDSFGWSLAVGDFNGDAKGDLAIGEPTYQGTVGAVDTLDSNGDGTFSNGVLWTHHLAGDDFGWSLAAGDFTGTGVDQLAIGAPGQGGSGAVSVIQNPALPTLKTLAPTTGQDGTAAVGTALAAGDFNGDGKDDLAIGAPHAAVDAGIVAVVNAPSASVATVALAGEVFVDYGVADSGSNSFQVWTQASSGIADDPESGDDFGASLAAVQLNKGVSDLVVGVPDEDIGLVDQGMIHVIRGSKFGELISKGSQAFSDETPGIQGTAITDGFFGAAAA